MPAQTAATDRLEDRPRAVALVGPAGTGKTTLFHALMSAAEAPAYNRGANVGHCRFKGELWRVIDGPVAPMLSEVDVAVVVCEPAPVQAFKLAPILADLQARGVPHILFANKIDLLACRVRDTVAALQEFSDRPLVLRQVPIREQGEVVGFVDVISARAYRYRAGEASALFSLPAQMLDRENEALEALLDGLGDRGEALNQKILNDIRLSSDEIFEQLKRDQQSGAIVQMLLGSARHGNGIRRLWMALRHDAPVPQMTVDRLQAPRATSSV